MTRRKAIAAAQVMSVSVLVFLSIVLFLVIVGTGIAKAAYELGGALGQGAPIPTWLAPERVITAIGSAIGALSGAVVAIGAIEWQDWRRRVGAIRVVQRSLDHANEAGHAFVEAAGSGDKTEATRLLIRTIVFFRTARDVAASQRDRTLHLARIAAELDALEPVFDALKARARKEHVLLPSVAERVLELVEDTARFSAMADGLED